MDSRFIELQHYVCNYHIRKTIKSVTTYYSIVGQVDYFCSFQNQTQLVGFSFKNYYLIYVIACSDRVVFSKANALYSVELTAQKTDSPSRNKAAELAFRSPSNFRQGHGRQAFVVVELPGRSALFASTSGRSRPGFGG